MYSNIMEEVKSVILHSQRENDEKYERYMSVIDSKRAVAMFGAGREGIRLSEHLTAVLPDKQLFFVDNDASKWGGKNCLRYLLSFTGNNEGIFG